tara:strand:- start:153 stop:476 length:324 start_codon:yes stop_codon:yes gene_type:complete
MLIGYVDSAVNAGNSKSSGIRVRAKLYNPSETSPSYDLRVPLMAFGTPAKILVNMCTTGDLVTVIGRMAMVKGPGGTNLEVLVEHIKSLDEDGGEDHEVEKHKRTKR